VDEHDLRRRSLRGAQYLLQKESIGFGESDVGVAEAGVHLERQVEVGRPCEHRPEHEVTQGLSAAADRYAGGQRLLGRAGIDVQTCPVGQNRLECHRAPAADSTMKRSTASGTSATHAPSAVARSTRGSRRAIFHTGRPANCS
jgi:hypothetical protein